MRLGGQQIRGMKQMLDIQVGREDKTVYTLPKKWYGIIN